MKTTHSDDGITDNQAKTRTSTAWMIRNDGSEFPVAMHIYADPDDVGELLELSWFLMVNDNESSQIVYSFLDTWSYCEFNKKLKSRIFAHEELLDVVKRYLDSELKVISTEKFVDTVVSSARLLRRRGSSKYIDSTQIKQDGSYLIESLNQRFLRARYGGRYDTISDCRDMYFRVSSIGFDWFPIMRDFTEKRSGLIDSVTIVRDFESTGCEKYYTDSAGNVYNKMPVPDFLAGTGCTAQPVANASHSPKGTMLEYLAAGYPLDKLRQLPMNQERMRFELQRLKKKEERMLKDIHIVD